MSEKTDGHIEPSDVAKQTKDASSPTLGKDGQQSMRGDWSAGDEEEKGKDNVSQENVDENEGWFMIDNWDGYPDGPKPEGPFKIIEGQEYKEARNAANTANNELHREDPSLEGLELHEIHPVKFGGSPTDLDNKIALTPTEHEECTKWWNRKLGELQSDQ